MKSAAGSRDAAVPSQQKTVFVQLGLGAAVAHDVLNGLVDRVLHVLFARRVKRHAVFRRLGLDEVVPGDVVDDALGHDVAVRLTRALIVDRAPVRDLHTRTSPQT